MDRRQSGTWGWFLQRISAIYLVFGIVVHLLATHYLMERPITFAQVQGRLLATHWVVFDLSLLVAAIFHGFNGAWGIVLDWNIGLKTRKVVGWSIVFLGFVVLVWGFRALIPFSTLGWNG